MTKVVNISRDSYDVYIGRRKNGFHFGNPFSSKDSDISQVSVSTRFQAIEAFEIWLFGTGYQDIEPERRNWILESLDLLRGKRLGCHCKPSHCHGDIYVRILDYGFPGEEFY